MNDLRKAIGRRISKKRLATAMKQAPVRAFLDSLYEFMELPTATLQDRPESGLNPGAGAF